MKRIADDLGVEVWEIVKAVPVGIALFIAFLAACSLIAALTPVP